MKRIVIERGRGSGWETAIGDRYMDRLVVYDGENVIYETLNAASYPSIKFGGGVLAPGRYGGIVGIHKNRIKAVLLFGYEFVEEVVKKKMSWQKVQQNLRMRTLPSAIYNPVRGNKTMIGVNIHDGGELPRGAKIDKSNPFSGTNFSTGCITIKKSDYGDFIKLFNINEVVEVEVVGL